MKRHLFSLTLILLLFCSCETDFELNAPYQTIPVVYGLLDQDLDTQIVKINKSFLGNSNNVNFASINDCTQFDYLIALLDEYNSTGDIIGTDTFREMYVHNIDPGIFYEDSQKVYFLSDTANPLNSNHEYELRVNVPDKDLNFSARTGLIDGDQLIFDFIFRISLKLNGYRCADKTLETDDEFYDTQIKWNTAQNGKRYELFLRFKFNEHKTDGSVESRFIDWDLGHQLSVSNGGDEEITKIIRGNNFFEMVNSKLSSDESFLESQVVKRTFDSTAIEFILTAGNETLNTYMEVNEPVTGIVTERPIFTNVNNGIGLFASKYQTELVCSMSAGTILELCLGQKTSGYKFCLPDINTPFYQNLLTELDLYPLVECD